ncbi:MAG: hypothetical protein ACTS3F_04505 [Phycisphaerales bacterium]
MTITLKQARPLCTKSEIELVEWSTPRRIKELDASRLRQKLARARKLRDKFRDLGDSQKRQIRGKESRASRGGPAQDNRNTRLKQELFEETAERFEAALTKREAAAGSGAGKKVSKKTGSGKGEGDGQKLSKKTGKKVAKKVGTKVGKKKAAKKKGAKRALAQQEMRQTNASMVGMSNEIRSKTKGMAFDRSGAKAHQGHVASRGRRRQAKRDSR